MNGLYASRINNKKPQPESFHGMWAVKTIGVVLYFWQFNNSWYEQVGSRGNGSFVLTIQTWEQQ